MNRWEELTCSAGKSMPELGSRDEAKDSTFLTDTTSHLNMLIVLGKDGHYSYTNALLYIIVIQMHDSLRSFLAKLSLSCV